MRKLFMGRLALFIPVQVALLAALGVCDGMLREVDKGLIVVGRSGKTLKNFYRALSSHEFNEMETLYERGRKNLNVLKRVLGSLLSSTAALGGIEAKLKDILIIEMEIMVENMQRVFMAPNVNR